MKRIEKVQAYLKQWEVDLLIVDNPIDLYYLTGEDLSAGRLIILEKEATLFVDGRYYEACKEKLSIPVELQTAETPFPTFEGKRMGFDAHVTTFEAYEKLSALKGKRISLSSPLSIFRMIKEKEEIEKLRQSAALCVKGFEFIAAQLKEGVTEEELAVQLEIFWKQKGGERLSFAPHIAFGANSAYPHYHVGPRSLKQGENVLIDLGVVLNHYHSDMTRVLFFGDPDEKLEEIYHIVQEAQEKALALCKPKTSLAELDRGAREVIEEKGYGKYFVHSTGHGVGLEIHEAPAIRKNASGELEEGMVITIEPGIYLPGVGGVRLEDTVVITPEGFEKLTLPSSKR